MRNRKREGAARGTRVHLHVLEGRNEVWFLDFMQDVLSGDGGSGSRRRKTPLTASAWPSRSTPRS